MTAMHPIGSSLLRISGCSLLSSSDRAKSLDRSKSTSMQDFEPEAFAFTSSTTEIRDSRS